MASIGSLTSSTTSSIRGYGGLSSGLDRDELIESMTLGTKTKINQQEQKKQKIEWMQEAIRTISDKMIAFHGKYTETLTSSSNMFSSVLWGRNKITTSGNNSKYVAVSGTASSADAITIMGVKQKAQNAAWSSPGIDSADYSKALESGVIDTSKTYAALDGKTLNFSYEGKNYTVTLGGDDSAQNQLQNADQVADAINAQLANYKVKDGTTLANLVEVTYDRFNSKYTIGKNLSAPDDSKTIKLTGGSALGYLGIENKEVDLSKSSAVGGSVNSDSLKKDFSQMVAGKTLTFSYNGESASIKIADGANTLEEVKNSLQEALNAKFGDGRVSVKIEDNSKLTLKTTVPGENTEDKSSILKLTGGDSEALKALQLEAGQSNRTNLDAKISTTGLTPDSEDLYSFKINGAEVKVKKGSTIRDLMNAINKSDANVTVSYQEAADKFTFTSKVDGASGVINFQGNDGSQISALNSMFSLGADDRTEKRGQDAIVAIKYAGSDKEVELRRGTNTFTVDGLTINVKGEFGYKEETIGDKTTKVLDPSADPVEVDAEVDVDKLLSTIKSFVEDYNSIVDMVNKELTTKHDNDYDPLSSEQKSELSDTEISKWETKAKEGLLYGDSDLRNLSMDLRVVVSGGFLVKFEEVGISLSSNYADGGKLSVDETKLRAALETDPEKVQNLFTSKKGFDADGNETYNGLATNLKNVMDKYVKTLGAMETKGILIRKAGSQSAAMSLTDNYYYNQIASINKILDTLNARLKAEQDRYISQFTSLETMINNMNSQSSYLSSMY